MSTVPPPEGFPPTPFLDRFGRRGTDFLGVRYPVLGGAMTWVSEHRLVTAIADAGGFGVLAGGNMPPDALDREIGLVRDRSRVPFGVNLITIAANFTSQLAVAARARVPFVIFGGTIPPRDAIRTAQAAGARVMAFAPTLAVARRLVKHGVDALILEGSEAGGHIGPVATSVLVQEILPAVSAVPVFVAGGIGNGAMIAQYLVMGAAGCQLGTRFVVATESVAHRRVKQAFIAAEARDAMPTSRFGAVLPAIPVRAIANEGTRAFIRLQVRLVAELEAGRVTREQAQRALEEFWVGALRRAIIDGDVVHGSLMAGQSVGMVRRVQPAAEIVRELVAEAETRLASVCRSGR